jgi:PAS domain S-box-containing protein
MSTAEPVKASGIAPPIDLDIEARLLREAYSREPLNIATTGGVAVVGFILLWPHADHIILVGWLIALLVVTALGYLQYVRFRQVQASGDAICAIVRKWQRIFAAKAVVAGAAWAVGPTLLIGQGIGGLDALVVGALLCVCAVGMTSVASQKNAMQGFILAALVPPGIAALIAGGTVEQLVAATLLAGAVILTKVGRDAAGTLRATMEAQIQLQAVLDGALDAVVTMDAQGLIMMWSQRAQLLLGWREDEVRGQALEGLVLVPEPEAPRQSGLARVMQKAASPHLGRRVERMAVRRDGSLLAVEVATSRASLGERVLTTAFIADISERKAAEERLALFRRVFDASSQSIVISDAMSRGLYQNRAHELAMGYSDQEIIGKPFAHALPQEVASTLWAEVKLAIAKDGAWEGQVPFRRKDGSEFMTASHIGSIKDQQGNIQYVFNLFNDFTPELARLEELRLAKEAAEQANLAKSDFLASMSHELRTPMNAVLGFGQILEFDESLTTEQLDNVTEILKGGRHLLKLINDVLDLAKIESSSIRLSMESVSVADLIGEAWRVLEPVALNRNITLHKNLPLVAAVTADRGRLKQVLLNLLSNAINFNRDGGEIGISIQTLPAGRLRIEIADSGQGIAPERLPIIFEAFNRRGTAHGQVGGTGIGLIITRRLVDLMGGDVGVESELGVGTTFCVDLPIANNMANSMANDMAKNAAGNANATEPMASDESLAHFDPSVHQYCVLCIDDNPVNVKLIAQLLTKRPRIHLISAHSPGLGIQLALGRQPDLILLDINMPGMDGYQVLEVLKTYARTKSIPIIAVTANAVPRSNALGGTTGLADYLTKPLEAEKFLATVDRWLEKGRTKNDDWPVI